MARCDAWRIVVVVLGIRRRDLYERGAKLRRGAIVRQGSSRGCTDAIASEPGLELLIGGERYAANVGGDHAHIRHAANEDRSRAIVGRTHPEAGRCACDQSAVVPPVEAKPGTALPGLVLQVSGLVELFVVIDSKHSARC